MGVVAGVALALLSVAYAIVLGVGLLALPSPDQPIQNPWFTVMEVLILLIAPLMVVFTVGLHSWVLPDRRSLSLLSVMFMSMCALLTTCVHFAVLTLSREPSFKEAAWTTLVFAFQWPSVVYAMDILAWDMFFPLAAFCAACAVHGGGLAGFARKILFGSAALAFLGLAGIPMVNMDIRNIGIIGYVVLFPIAAVMLAIVFQRDAARGAA